MNYIYKSIKYYQEDLFLSFKNINLIRCYKRYGSLGLNSFWYICVINIWFDSTHDDIFYNVHGNIIWVLSHCHLSVHLLINFVKKLFLPNCFNLHILDKVLIVVIKRYYAVIKMEIIHSVTLNIDIICLNVNTHSIREVLIKLLKVF